MTHNTSGIDTADFSIRGLGPAPGGEPVSPAVYPELDLRLADAGAWGRNRGQLAPAALLYPIRLAQCCAWSRSLSLSLEGAESAVAVGSGMAAIAAAILSNVRAGDHVVAQSAHYTAALTLFTEWLPRQGVEDHAG